MNEWVRGRIPEAGGREMVQDLLVALVALLAGGLLYAMAAARVVKQYERGVVLRLGRPTTRCDGRASP